MRQVFSLVSAFLVFVLLVMTNPAEAKQEAGDIALIPFAGGYTFEGNQGMKTGPVYGLRLGTALTSRWGIEGTVEVVSTQRKSDSKI